jgi:hypothetical protein
LAPGLIRIASFFLFLTGVAYAGAAGDRHHCAPAGALSFLCGAIKPEDLKQLPGTPYLVASGFSPGSGLKLVDTRAKAFSFWYLGLPGQITPDRDHYPDCTTPPNPRFSMPGASACAE